jgi:hypothetical protein
MNLNKIYIGIFQLELYVINNMHFIYRSSIKEVVKPPFIEKIIFA